MKQNKIIKNYDEFENDIKILRAICLVGGILTPVVTFWWKYNYPHLKASELNGWIFACGFFAIFFLSFFNGFIKKNVRKISYGMFIVSSISGLFFAYINNFSLGYTLLMFLVIFVVVWIFNHPLHILAYVTCIFILLAIALYASDRTNSDREIILSLIALFGLFSYLIAKSRYNIQVELKKNQEVLRYISYHDKVTDLYNRSYFEEEISRLNKSGQLSIGFIIGDVNGLKLTNDVFGHKKGDELLKKVSRILKESCRKEDIIARIGGDEFAIIMYNIDETTLQNIQNSIAKKCEEEKSDPIKPNLTIGSAIKMSPSEDIDYIIKIAEVKMYEKKLIEGKIVRKSIINSLLETLAKTSTETEDHINRLEVMAIQVAVSLGLTAEEINALSTLANLHDIGKIAVPEQILNKTSELTSDEWVAIKQHSETGYRVATMVAEFAPIANFILYHHERWDGKGYPYGLKEDEIPLLSRIISVVDAYDVMTHDKPYRKRMSEDEVIKELYRCSGSQFDPDVINAFVRNLSLN